MITRASDSSPARLNLLRNSPDFEALPMTDEIGKIDSPSTRSEPVHRVSINASTLHSKDAVCSLTNQNVSTRFRNASTSCDCSLVNSNFLYLTSSSAFNKSIQSSMTTSNATCKVGLLSFLNLSHSIFLFAFKIF